MRGASAAALERLTDRLAAGFGDEGSGGDARRLGDDLLGLAAIVRSQPGLRRILTDVSVSSDAKAGLVRSIFGEQLSDPALDLATEAVGQRWASTYDLADAFEHLGVVALVRSADAGGDGDALEDELFAFAQLVNRTPELRDALSDPVRSVEDKQALVRTLLDGHVGDATVRLAEQAVVGTHRTVAAALEEYQRLAAEHRDQLVATVQAAAPLADDQAQRLQEALRRQYGRAVHLNVVVDPEVLGGLRVEVGHEVIDGTVATRLDEARRALAS